MRGQLDANWIMMHGLVLAESCSLSVFLQKDWPLTKIVLVSSLRFEFALVAFLQCKCLVRAVLSQEILADHCSLCT